MVHIRQLFADAPHKTEGQPHQRVDPGACGVEAYDAEARAPFPADRLWQAQGTAIRLWVGVTSDRLGEEPSETVKNDDVLPFASPVLEHLWIRDVPQNRCSQLPLGARDVVDSEGCFRFVVLEHPY